MIGSRQQLLPAELRPRLPCAAVHGLRLLARQLLALLLALSLAETLLPLEPAAALSLPWRQPTADSRPAEPSGGLAALQEISPPEAVQQLQAALAGRQPVVEIVSPQPDSLMPPGPWTLRLRVHDWPLVDGGPLGIGPHLVVQLDQEPPLIWTRSEGTLPELSPGSHRLSVYAALPWGEARKNPGAAAQIRLHRTAANPLALPAAGSPQLLAVSPSGAASEEPLLLDWLLLDAPLQDVGGNGTQWRLRVSVNGDAVLLDQQAPLWLRGWRPGRNALLLELLDGRGEPLNPPYNSVVQEVNLDRQAPTPRWRGGRLSAAELAILLGEAPPGPRPEPPMMAAPSPPAPTPPTPAAASGVRAGQDPGPVASSQPAVESAAPPAGPAPTPRPAPSLTSPTVQMPPDGSQEQAADPASTSPAPRALSTAGEAAMAAAGADGAPQETSGPRRQSPGDRSGSADSPADRPTATAAPSATAPASGADGSPSGRETAPTGLPEPSASAAAPSAATGLASASVSPGRQPGGANLDLPAPAADPHPIESSMTAASATSEPSADPPTAAGSPVPPTAANDLSPLSPTRGNDPERVHPSSDLGGRARDLVNDDGTLRRPERRGPLAGLRERLQR